MKSAPFSKRWLFAILVFFCTFGFASSRQNTVVLCRKFSSFANRNCVCVCTRFQTNNENTTKRSISLSHCGCFAYAIALVPSRFHVTACWFCHRTPYYIVACIRAERTSVAQDFRRRTFFGCICMRRHFVAVCWPMLDARHRCSLCTVHTVCCVLDICNVCFYLSNSVCPFHSFRCHSDSRARVPLHLFSCTRTAVRSCYVSWICCLFSDCFTQKVSLYAIISRDFDFKSTKSWSIQPIQRTIEHAAESLK